MSLQNKSDKPAVCPPKTEPGGNKSGSHEDEQKLPDWQFDDEFDGGEETCGRVIVNLYLYIKDQQPGHRILVISRDPGAPVELPSWCRMTQNELTKMKHPYYLITLKPHLQRS